MSAVSLFSTPELIAEYAKPGQDIFGNPIQVGATVRSFNLATLLNDGRIYGMDTRITASNRVDFIEGKVVAIGEIVHEGCPRYTIQITRECYSAEGVDTSDVCYGTGHLDPRPRGFDGLGMAETGQVFRGDQHLDTSRHSGLTADQAGAFQGQDHLVHGRRTDLEMALHVGLSRGTAMDAGVSVDEGQVLALPVSEALSGHSPHARFIG